MYLFKLFKNVCLLFSVDGHEARYEGLELARERDQRSMEAW